MPRDADSPFPVVGVGASAGGLGALSSLIGALPPRPGLALVIVQHLDPHHESHLAELLRRQTSMTVVDAAHGSPVLADHVYVIQPNTDVAITDGVLSVTPRPADRRPHYPVDHFFRSLAQVQGPHAIGVVLSGTGSDGMLGVCEIKAAGGVTFAQDERSAQHAGMPQSAVASGAVDLVLPPEQIAAHLATLPQHPYLAAGAEQQAADDAQQFHHVVNALRSSSGVDFSQYRDTTIKRRTARRMLLRGFRSPLDYARLIERDRAEAEALYRDVLINVTSFFRDPEMFEDLKHEVFPAIVAAKGETDPIRVWTPGCSTGQEAYSIAIALTECLDDAAIPRTIQIFATDLGDPGCLDKARAAVYPESIESEVSPERLRRFFIKKDGAYRVQKSLRDQVVFARQNITVDPPFSRVDLVTCRNVLIYMSPALQHRLLPVFHFALNPDGFLVLGLAETVGRFGDLFELVNRTHKIYRKTATSYRPQLSFMADERLGGVQARRPSVSRRPPSDLQQEADRLLLGRYAPPSVLVNQEFEIQEFRGRTARFLEAPAGQPTTNILRMAKEGLFLDLRSALTEALATRAPVVREALHVVDAGADLEFTLRVLPVTVAPSSDLCLAVVFEAVDSVLPLPAIPVDEVMPGLAERDIAALRRELASSKEYLQSIVDRQEADGQELRAAHEELLSSNEELQSTNEELETTKEELQSANEELTTVNEQLERRNRELDSLTDDLSNFISSADLPMVTVGRDLTIRRLTPAAQRVFNLLPTDVGRSLEHIKFSLRIDAIGAAIEAVISSGQPWEREVIDREGRWWMLRVRPYQTTDGRIDGATIVAVDVHVIKHTAELLEGRDYALSIVQTVREPLVVLDGRLRVSLANAAFYALFGSSADQIEGRLLFETGRGAWDDASIRHALVKAVTDGAPVTNLEVDRTLAGHGRRTLVLNARSIVREARPTLLLLAVEDVTERREAEALRADAESMRLVDKRKDEFLGILAHELRNPLAPMRFALEILRQSKGDAIEATRARQVLERQINHLVRIVDDLLDVSRITHGRVELRKESVALSSLVEGAVELCRPLIETARHSITVSLPGEVVTLQADPVRLSQVLINLLHNAVKFSPPGGHIWLIAERIGGSEDHPDQVRIRVRDSGIGIAPDIRPKIFELFMQGDSSVERSRTGLGVGLSLVRSLVALHGGTVDVESGGPGTGSEFIVSLPIEAPPQQEAVAPAARPASRSSKGLRILVADDYDDAREMLGFLLTKEGHEVATAVDGSSALAAAVEFKPDVAILDIGMPGMSGYDVARSLQSQAGAPVLLVALSGLGQREDRARAATAGFHHHFTKPLDASALLTFLATIRRDRD